MTKRDATKTTARRRVCSTPVTSYRMKWREETSRLKQYYELAATRHARAEAKQLGIKVTKFKQTWRGKKFKNEKIVRGDGRGIDACQYGTSSTSADPYCGRNANDRVAMAKRSDRATTPALMYSPGALVSRLCFLIRHSS